METHGHIDPKLHQRLIAALRQHADPEWFEDLCGCVPPILDMLGDSHDVPITEHEEAIRQIVCDRCLVGASGARRYDQHEQIERHTRLLMRELATMVKVQLRRGEWSDTPVPPQMFG